MKKIFSNVSEDVLMHIVVHKDDISTERINVVEPNEFLQLAIMRLQEGKTFPPHKHIIHEKTVDIAQESWVVIEGRVKAILYDLDDTIISEEILKPGDCSITLRGGHTYEILEDDTLVYEYKTGPYLGVELDKEFIK